MSVANGLLNDAFWLDNELMYHVTDMGEKIIGELANSFVEWTPSTAYILTTYILTKRTDFLYDIVKGKVFF